MSSTGGGGGLPREGVSCRFGIRNLTSLNFEAQLDGKIIAPSGRRAGRQKPLDRAKLGRNLSHSLRHFVGK